MEISLTKNDKKYKIKLGGNMISKEKSPKIVDTKKAIIIITCFVIFCAFSILLAVIGILSKNTTYASAIAEQQAQQAVDYSNIESDIDIMDILNKNTKEEYVEEFIVEETTQEYITVYEEDNSLPKGMVKVLQEGIDGKEQQTIKKIYVNGQLNTEERTDSKIIKPSINKIVAVGTSPYTSNYKVKVGDTLYVTPNTLSVMSQPNKDAEKILTIYSESEVKLIEIQKEWYKISYNNYTGYAPANCFIYIKPKSLIQNNSGTEENYSKEQLLSKLNFSMNLNEPSGLTLEQFRRILSANDRDKNKIFENNADYFYYIEKQYKINGVFVAALGIHESGWGTSKICLNKRNLFGYGAYDRDPYNSAYSYNDYSESIDLIARVLVKYYLNPAGTSIYDGQVASGAYYYGSTLTDVNRKYATDKNWANSIYTWMQFLYNNL